MKKTSFSRIALVTTSESWFYQYPLEFKRELKDQGFIVDVFSKYEVIDNDPEVVFLLSYFS